MWREKNTKKSIGSVQGLEDLELQLFIWQSYLLYIVED